MIDPKSMSNEDKIEASQCKFGSLTLWRGEKLIDEKDKYHHIVCKCMIPPFITCSEMR